MEIKAGMSWPPMDLERYKMKEHSTWYTGEADLLANFYYDNSVGKHMSLAYSTLNCNRFWARQIKNKSDFYIHVPIANDIAETSSAFLFGESPIVRFASSTEAMKDVQKALDKMLTKSGLFQKLIEGAEVASAIGGVFIKINWDTELSDEPIPTLVQAEQAFPVFKFGKLYSVNFIYDVGVDGSAYYRLSEDICKGKIVNKLYQGTTDTLGDEVPLTTIKATESMEQEVDTADVMTAVYIPNMLPNKLNRSSPSGRSDFQGQETLMDALDEAFSNWMIDVQIARGKIHIPEGYITRLGDDTKASFNLDEVMYEEMTCDPTSLTAAITATQFEIRANDYEKTCLNLLDRIITSAGYSPQSFGLNITGRAESGTALNVRERKSFSTTNKKQAYWEEPIKAIVKAMCMIKNSKMGGKFEVDLDVNVAFADCIANNGADVANVIKILSDAKAISTDTKIRMAHPEWTDEQIAAEVELINNDSNVGIPIDNPDDISQMGIGMENQEDELGLQNDKQKGSMIPTKS